MPLSVLSAPYEWVYRKNLRVRSFTSLLGGCWREEDRSNLGYTGAGILVSAASVFSEHTGSFWLYPV